jgi:F-type H+-transporting ATPase subunit c
VNRLVKIAALMTVMSAMAVPVMAQEPAQDPQIGSPTRGFSITLTGAFGAGLVSIGAAYGIGRLAGSALESMARQPEVAGNIQTAMIIAAALIEGFTFFALFICMQQNPWAGG